MDALIKSLTLFPCDICYDESIPLSWNESPILPTFRNGTRNEYGNHHGIGSIRKGAYGLASMMSWRLIDSRTASRSSSGWASRQPDFHISSVTWNAPHKMSSDRPSFCLLKGTSDSVGQTASFSALYWMNVLAKFVNLLLAYLWSHEGIRWAIKFCRNDYQWSTKVSHLSILTRLRPWLGNVVQWSTFGILIQRARV